MEQGNHHNQNSSSSKNLAEVLSNYLAIKVEIAESLAHCEDANRAVRLIVVSKFQPLDKIRILLAAGHRDFGESRIEEISKKWAILRQEYPDVTLHFIGAIQSRKVRDIVKYVDVVHSLDRVEIAEKISRECHLQNKTLICLIQVNVGQEPQKAGIKLEDFQAFLTASSKLSGLVIDGAMCIPPAAGDPSSYFETMQKLKRAYSLKELSMGMSRDYLKALKYGSTMLRVGTKILGARI